MIKIPLVLFLLLAFTCCCYCNTVGCPVGLVDGTINSGQCEMTLPDISCFNGVLPHYCSNNTFCNSCTNTTKHQKCSQIMAIHVLSTTSKSVYTNVKFCNCTCGNITCNSPYIYSAIHRDFSTECETQLYQNGYGSGYNSDDSDLDYEFDYEYDYDYDSDDPKSQ